MANKDGHAPHGDGCFDMCGKYHRWRIGVFDPVTGKTRYVALKAKTRRKLQEKVDAWREEHGDDAPVTGKRILLRDWVERWLKSLEGKRAARTIYAYRSTLECHLLPRLGGKLLGKISSYELQDLFDQMARKISPATVFRVRGTISACFGRAARLGIIKENPVARTEAPRREQKELRILEQSDVARILEVARDGSYRTHTSSDSDKYLIRRNYLVVLLAASAGLRQGEILGLTWPCVDTTNARLEIRHSLEYMPHRKGLKSPKSGKPRTVAIPVSVAAEVAEWKKYQAEYAAKYRGIYDNPENLVFTSETGGYVYGSCFTKATFGKICEKAGVHEKKFHNLRHFFASSALAAGLNVAAVSEQLGHATIDITLKIYTHVMQKSRNELRLAMDSNPLFLAKYEEKEC